MKIYKTNFDVSYETTLLEFDTTMKKYKLQYKLNHQIDTGHGNPNITAMSSNKKNIQNFIESHKYLNPSKIYV